ncbi:MAG: hypothetical protein MUP16_02810, partial [Sedimentisphaerales bacterium]|nr:hypothetical protein [Sedimentisphaerales bacterium]
MGFTILQQNHEDTRLRRSIPRWSPISIYLPKEESQIINYRCLISASPASLPGGNVVDAVDETRALRIPLGRAKAALS